MYDIDFDSDQRIVHIRTRGIWSAVTIATFTTEVLTRGTAWRLRHGPFAVLADVRDAPVQPADVASGTAAMMAAATRLIAAPIATVVGSMLGKLQSERVMTGPYCRTFLDMEAARAWLEESWLVPNRAARK